MLHELESREVAAVAVEAIGMIVATIVTRAAVTGREDPLRHAVIQITSRKNRINGREDMLPHHSNKINKLAVDAVGKVANAVAIRTALPFMMDQWSLLSSRKIIGAQKRILQSLLLLKSKSCQC